MEKDKMKVKKEDGFIKGFIKDIGETIIFGAVFRILFFIPRLVFRFFKNM